MPKTVLAIGVGRCCSTAGEGLVSADSGWRELGQLAARGRRAAPAGRTRACSLGRELVAMLGQPLLGNRDQELHLVPLLLAEGDFQVLAADASAAARRCSARPQRPRPGGRPTSASTGRRRSAACLLAASRAISPALGLRADDHHQDDQDADEVGDHVQERVLAGSFGCRCGVHAGVACSFELGSKLAACPNGFAAISKPLLCRAVCRSAKWCSASGRLRTSRTRFPVAVLDGQAPGLHFLLHAGDEGVDFGLAASIGRKRRCCCGRSSPFSGTSTKRSASTAT